MVWLRSREYQITRGEFKEPEISELEESSMYKSYLNAQAQEIIPVSEQQMNSNNYQIILCSAVIYLPSETQNTSMLSTSPMHFHLFIYLFSNSYKFPNILLAYSRYFNKYSLMDTETWWVIKPGSEGMKRQISEQLSFSYHIHQRQFLIIYSCLPFRLHHTHNSFTNHCPSYLLFKDTAADEAIFYVWLQELYIINN